MSFIAGMIDSIRVFVHRLGNSRLIGLLLSDWILRENQHALWSSLRGKGCHKALMAVGAVAVKEPTCARQRCNWGGGGPLLFLVAFLLHQLWREPGRYPLTTGEQRELLKNSMHKLCCVPKTLSTSDKNSINNRPQCLSTSSISSPKPSREYFSTLVGSRTTSATFNWIPMSSFLLKWI